MKKILTERLQKLAGIKNLKEEEKKQTKTIAGLADAFREISIGLRKGDYKGVQGAEITEIKRLLDLILQAAMDTNLTTIIKRLESMVGKSIKTPDTTDNLDDQPVDPNFSEPMGDIDDSEII